MRRWLMIVAAAAVLTSGAAEASGKYRNPDNCTVPPCPWERDERSPARDRMVLAAERDYNPTGDLHIQRGWNEHRIWYGTRPDRGLRS